MASQDSKARAAGVAETDESNARFANLRYAAFTCQTGFTGGRSGRVAIDPAAYRLKSP
jgi:hypothetical protein